MRTLSTIRLNSTKLPTLLMFACHSYLLMFCICFVVLRKCENQRGAGVMRVGFHDGCLADNRVEGLEDMLLLFLILVQVSLLVQPHPLLRSRHDPKWDIPRVVQTKSDRFYLYLPQATIWKWKWFASTKIITRIYLIFFGVGVGEGGLH